MESYHINLETILRVLSRHSGELRALVKRVPGTKEEGLARVMLDKGKIVSCSIESRIETLYSEDDALRLLQAIGELDWIFIPSIPQPSSLSVAPQVLSPSTEPILEIFLTAFPVRLRLVGPQELASWPRLHRSVYNLVDGRKTVEAIAQVLSNRHKRVVEALSILRANGIIALSTQPSGNPISDLERRLPPLFE